MSAPQNFRTAFNGFNREDVVRYLEYLNTKHTAQVNQLTSEADYLRSKLEAMQEQPAPDPALEESVAALERERDDLRAQLADLQARYDALAQQAQAPAPQPEPQQATFSFGASQELEAYRRAERTERMAKERAEQLYRKTNGVLAEATVKVDSVAAEIGAMADQVVSQLSQLQAAVSSSKQALQDAAATMYTIRPENNQ